MVMSISVQKKATGEYYNGGLLVLSLWPMDMQKLSIKESVQPLA